jgi:hypothetical protein
MIRNGTRMTQIDRIWADGEWNTDETDGKDLGR